MVEESPSEKQLRESLDQFAALLEQKRIQERVWQEFFTEHPHVLAKGLPLGLKPGDFRILGRNGRSEPDIVFVDQQHPTRTFGVIELKRADQNVVEEPRNEIIALSQSATTAVAQLRKYGHDLEKQVHGPGPGLGAALLFGSRAHLFAIMGLRKEDSERIVKTAAEWQLYDLMPKDVRFFGYDDVFTYYKDSIPKRCIVLIPDRTRIGFETFSAHDRATGLKSWYADRDIASVLRRLGAISESKNGPIRFPKSNTQIRMRLPSNTALSIWAPGVGGPAEWRISVYEDRRRPDVVIGAEGGFLVDVWLAGFSRHTKGLVPERYRRQRERGIYQVSWRPIKGGLYFPVSGGADDAMEYAALMQGFDAVRES